MNNLHEFLLLAVILGTFLAWGIWKHRQLIGDLEMMTLIFTPSWQREQSQIMAGIRRIAMEREAQRLADLRGIYSRYLMDNVGYSMNTQQKFIRPQIQVFEGSDHYLTESEEKPC